MNGKERIALLEGIFKDYKESTLNPIRPIKINRVRAYLHGTIQRRKSVRDGEISFKVKMTESFTSGDEAKVTMSVREHMCPEDASIRFIHTMGMDGIPDTRILTADEVGRYIVEICVSFMS